MRTGCRAYSTTDPIGPGPRRSATAGMVRLSKEWGARELPNSGPHSLNTTRPGKNQLQVLSQQLKTEAQATSHCSPPPIHSTSPPRSRPLLLQINRRIDYLS